MENIYLLLELPTDAAASEVEETYQARYEHWLSIKSNRPERSAEAEEQIRRLEDAYDFYQKHQRQDITAGLEVRDQPKQGGTRTTSSGQGVSEKDMCPHCGYSENPSNARYCLECTGQLFQTCPSCGRELPWHYKSCHHCGVNIDAYEDKKRQEESTRLTQERERKQRELAKVQADYSFIKSPPISGYFWFTGSGAKVRELSGEGLFGCRSNLLGIGVLFGTLTLLILISPIIDAIFGNSGLGIIVLLVVFAGMLLLSMRLIYQLAYQQPALKKLQQRETQLRRELNEIERLRS